MLYEKWENISLKAQLLQTLYLTENQRLTRQLAILNFGFFFAHTQSTFSHYNGLRLCKCWLVCACCSLTITTNVLFCPLLIAYCIILNMFIFAKQLSNNLKTYGVLKSLHSTAFSKYIAFVMMSFTSDFNILSENAIYGWSMYDGVLVMLSSNTIC